MIVEKNSLNPNCSEAVMHIRTDRLSEQEKDELCGILEKAAEEYDNDTWVTEGELFGIQVITVSGDMPYNEPDKLGEIVDKYDVDVEFADQ